MAVWFRLLHRIRWYVLAVLVLLFWSCPVKADIASGNAYGTPWHITDGGDLIIGDGTERTIWPSINYNIENGDWTNDPNTGYRIISVSTPWWPHREKIVSIKINGTLHVASGYNCPYMFADMHNAKSIDMRGLDVSKVTNFSGMFRDCRSCTDFNLTGFNTSSGIWLDTIFSKCISVKHLDVSSFRTGSARSLVGLFYRCYSLESVDVTGFDTSKCESFSDMFGACQSLKSIDVSHFDTSRATCFIWMFQDCQSLTELDLSNFDVSKATGNYDNSLGLRGMFRHCFSLKKLDLSSFKVVAGDVTYLFLNCYALEEIIMPNIDTRNVKYMYSVFTGCTNLSKITVGSNFVFKGGSKIVTPIDGDPRLWCRVGGQSADQGLTAYQLSTKTGTDIAGTWVLDLVSYAIDYDNGGAVGSIGRKWCRKQDDYTVLSSADLRKFGYVFDHWAGSDGKIYKSGDSIPGGTFSTGDVLVLTAVWTPEDKFVTMNDGLFDFVLTDGTKAIFDGLPYGTKYQVYEDSEDGWFLVGSSDTSGQLLGPSGVYSAKFMNKYEPGVTGVVLRGMKTFDGDIPESGYYCFALFEDDAMLQTVFNDDGLISFDRLVYDRVGEHDYKIIELFFDDDKIMFDGHVEKVHVSVKDDGNGSLFSEIIYDSDGILFENRLKPGLLDLQKQVVGQYIFKSDFAVEIDFQ